MRLEKRELAVTPGGLHLPAQLLETALLNLVNYQTLIMILSDAPHYVSKKKNGKPKDERSAEEEANDIVGFFQSKLK